MSGERASSFVASIGEQLRNLCKRPAVYFCDRSNRPACLETALIGHALIAVSLLHRDVESLGRRISCVIATWTSIGAVSVTSTELDVEREALKVESPP